MKAKKKITRLWSILLTFVMVAGMLPTVALAAGSSPATPPEQTVTLPSELATEPATQSELTLTPASETGVAPASTTATATITADFTDDTEAAITALGGSSVADWDGNTLTLNGVNLTAADPIAVKLPAGATIDLIGDNTITGGGSSSEHCYGIYAAGNLTIQGSGTLTVTGGDTTNSNYSYGIYADSNVTIESGTVTGGTVTANGGQATVGNSYGIYASVRCTIESGTVTAIGGGLDFNSRQGHVIYGTGTSAITFGANGGTGAMKAATNSSTYPLPANVFTAPVGKQFKGWATSADGEVISTATIDVAADTTLFAIWEPIPSTTTYTITFDANGGDSLTPASAETDANGKLSSLPTPTRSGRYSFDGWFTVDGTKVDTSTVFSADTTIFARWTYTGGGSSGGGGSTVPPKYCQCGQRQERQCGYQLQERS